MNSDSDLKDLVQANLQKALGIAALLDASTNTTQVVTSEELASATWALEGFLTEAKSAFDDLANK